MLPRMIELAHKEPPLPFADRRGIFICAYYFSCREKSATQGENYKLQKAMQEYLALS